MPRSDAHDALVAARRGIEERRYADAKTHAQAVLEVDPENAEAWYLCGLAAEGIGDYDGAISCLEQAAARHADSTIVVRRATCLWRLGRAGEALASIEGLSPAAAHDPDVELLRATLLHALGRYDEARGVAESGLSRAPESPLLLARLGATLMRLRRYEEARARFLKAAEIFPRLGHCRLVRVDRTAWAELDQPPAELPDEPHVVYEDAAPCAASFVVSVACDAVYLHRYGAAFARSFAAHAGANARLHLHVIDPDDAFAAFLDAMTRETRLPGLRVTIEYCPDDVAEHLNARRTYYSCARFLHLPWMMREYRMPVVVLDVDAVVEHPLDDLAMLARLGDVALLLRDPPDSPWLDVVANHVVLAASAPALRFAERVRNFIARRSALPDLKWHLDQIALCCVREMCIEYDEPVRFVPIPPALQERIWHIGNFYRYLLADERFQRHAAPFTAKAPK